MPQSRFWNFKQDDKTAFLNRWLTGVIAPGLYFGFDFAPSANMNLTLNHNTTGFVDVDDDAVESDKQSLIVTRQGVHIRENTSLTINGIAVGDGSNPRIDIVVCTHAINEVSGGSTALYSVIQGTPGSSPVAPILANPMTQTKIGELYIPAGTTALNGVGVTWTRMPKPGYAGFTLTPSRAMITDAGGNPAVSVVTATELSRLSGVTSNIQTQFGGKQDTITGAASTIVSSDLAGNRVVVTNGSGKIVNSSTSDTELSRLAGVSSDIQPQLNNRLRIDGANNMTADLNMGFHKIYNLNTPSSADDGANKSYVDSGLGGKQDTVVGAASTIVSSNLTANRALASNGSGKVVVSAVTDTELGYLAGVTSAIQTQFNTLNAIKHAKLDIGDWNMDSTATAFVTHGLDPSKIIGAEAYIKDDVVVSNHSVINLNKGGNTAWVSDGTTIILNRDNAGYFDNTGYDATSYNRGYIIIHYLP